MFLQNARVYADGVVAGSKVHLIVEGSGTVRLHFKLIGTYAENSCASIKSDTSGIDRDFNRKPRDQWRHGQRRGTASGSLIAFGMHNENIRSSIGKSELIYLLCRDDRAGGGAEARFKDGCAPVVGA